MDTPQSSQKPNTTIRLFDRNEIYTVHGSDALFVAQDYFRTSAVVKTYGSGADKLESVWLNKIKFESLLRHLLLIRQYRVELYKTTGAYSRIGHNDWALAYKGSPGNLSQFEETLFGLSGQSAPAGVVGVKLSSDGGQKTVGLGYADITSLSLRVAQFIDNDQFSNLEAALVQLDPKEVLVGGGDLQTEATLKQILERSSVLVTEFKKSDLQAETTLRQILERSSVLVTQYKKSSFTTKDNVQDLTRLLKLKPGTDKQVVSMPELEKTQGMCAVAALIKYLELMSKDDLFGQFTLASFDLDQYMRLDAAAVRALNLMPSPYEGGNKHQSVYGLLNHCHTPQGQRLLCHWVRQPLLDPNKIEERLNLVEIFVTNPELRQVLHDDQLTRIPDYQRLAKKFHRTKATLQDCYRVYESLDKLPHLIESLRSYSGTNHTLLVAVFCDPLTELVRDFAKFQEMIETTMDLSKVDSHEFVVKPDFDDDLAEMRKKMDAVEGDIKIQLNTVTRDLGLDAKTVKLESNSQLGYFLRITRKDEKVLRNNKTYKTIDTNKNGVRFRNSRLTHLNTEFMQLRDDYNKQQGSVVNEIISIASGYCEPMLLLNDILSQLDVIVSFAIASVCAPTPYVRPTIHPIGSGVLKLTEARHPCVEMQDDVAFIPNDVTFEKGIMFVMFDENLALYILHRLCAACICGVSASLLRQGTFLPPSQFSLTFTVLR